MLGPIMLVVFLVFLVAASLYERREARRREVLAAMADRIANVAKMAEEFKALGQSMTLIVDSIEKFGERLAASMERDRTRIDGLPVVESNLVPPGTALVVNPGFLLEVPPVEFEWAPEALDRRRDLFMYSHLVVNPDPEDRSFVKITGLEV